MSTAFFFLRGHPYIWHTTVRHDYYGSTSPCTILLPSTMALHHSTWLYKTYHCSTSFCLSLHYFTMFLLHSVILHYSSMALLHSTWLYVTLPWLYFTTWLYTNCTITSLHSTWLYITVPRTSLHCFPQRSASLYLVDSTLFYHGSTSPYISLLPSRPTIVQFHSAWLYITLPWLYFTPPSLNLTLHYSSTALFLSTWLYCFLLRLYFTLLPSIMALLHSTASYHSSTSWL